MLRMLSSQLFLFFCFVRHVLLFLIRLHWLVTVNTPRGSGWTVLTARWSDCCCRRSFCRRLVMRRFIQTTHPPQPLSRSRSFGTNARIVPLDLSSTAAAILHTHTHKEKKERKIKYHREIFFILFYYYYYYSADITFAHTEYYIYYRLPRSAPLPSFTTSDSLTSLVCSWRESR